MRTTETHRIKHSLAGLPNKNPPRIEVWVDLAHRLSSPVSASRWVFVGTGLIGCGVSAERCHADEVVTNDAGIMQLAQSAVSAPGLGIPATIPPPPGPAPQRFSEIDRLKPNRGWTIPLPGAADTVDQGLFGVRQALADAGFSYLGIESGTFVDNLLRHGGPPGGIRGNQQYSGQRPTYTSSYTQYLAYDLTGYGIPDGQIVVAGVNLSTNWDPGGPNKVALATASYYQTLFNKAIELKFGYLVNGTEFLGTQVGGSLAGGVFGVSAALTIEQGENAGVFHPGRQRKVQSTRELLRQDRRPTRD